METYFLAIIGIFISIFTALYGVYYFIDRPRKKETRKKLVLKAFKHDVIITIVLVILLIISPLIRNVIIVNFNIFSFDRTSNPQINELLLKNIFKNDTSVKVLVTPFREFGTKSNVKNVGNILADYISTKLDESYDKNELDIEIKWISDTLIDQVNNHQSALEIGDVTGADIVIWGELIPPLFQFQEYYILPHLTLRRPIRDIGNSIDFNVVRILSSRAVGFPFPKQLLDSPNQFLLFIIGYYYFLENNWSFAINNFEESINVNSKEITYLDNIYYYLGSTYIAKIWSTGSVNSEEGQFYLEKAKDAFLQAIDINEYNPYALNGLGVVEYYSQSKSTEEVIKYYKAALNIDSSLIFVSSNLANKYIESNQPDSAIPLLKKELEIANKYPNDLERSKAGTLKKLALAYYQMGDFNKAESIFVKIIKTIPVELSWDSYSDLSFLYYSQGKFDQALSILIDINDKMPNNPFIKANLGTMYLQIKEYEKGVSLMKQALTTLPPDHQIQYSYNIFSGYCLLNNPDSASFYFQKVEKYLDQPLGSLLGQSLLDNLNNEVIEDSIDEALLENKIFLEHMGKYID